MSEEKKKELNVSDDKYKDKPLKFRDCGDHYELVFADLFMHPDKDYTVATEIMIDLKDADKNKEIHVYINSDGGCCSNLSMIVQQLLEFHHCVTIVIGNAISAGFVLFCCGKERYVSAYSELMFHGITAFAFNKASEISAIGKHVEGLERTLFDAVDIRDILIDAEIEKGKTTEIWFLGEEMIKRGVAKDFSKFKERAMPTKEEFLSKNNRYFHFEDNIFVEYKKTDKKFSYTELSLMKKDRDSACGDSALDIHAKNKKTIHKAREQG